MDDVPVRKSVWAFPHATRTTLRPDKLSIRVGTSRRVVSPWANWAFSFRPDQQSLHIQLQTTIHKSPRIFCPLTQKQLIQLKVHSSSVLSLLFSEAFNIDCDMLWLFKMFNGCTDVLINPWSSPEGHYNFISGLTYDMIRHSVPTLSEYEATLVHTLP